jgi:4-hydroxy-tetrahydrodipicolinate synthase
MVAPSPYVRGEKALVAYYKSVGDGSPLPIVVQDHPAATGVTMSVNAIASMSREIESVAALKLEEAPTLAKVSAVRRATHGRLPIFGGLGGVFLMEELARGASGVMTGFAFPEVLRDVCSAFAAGEVERASRIFYRFLPLILYESQGGPALLLRKEIYRLRGLIASNRLRAPSVELDQQVPGEIQRIAATVGLSFSATLAVEPRDFIQREVA